MGDRLEIPGTAGMGWDTFAAKRQVDSVSPGAPTGSFQAKVALGR